MGLLFPHDIFFFKAGNLCALVWIQCNIPINITVFRNPNDKGQQDNFLQSGVELSSGEAKANPAIGQPGIWTRHHETWTLRLDHYVTALSKYMSRKYQNIYFTEICYTKYGELSRIFSRRTESRLSINQSNFTRFFKDANKD